MTPLHIAAREGDSERVRSLLREGADVHALDDLGRTALYYAAFARCAEAVTALLAAGSDPNRGDEGGVTPLMAAIGMYMGWGYDSSGPGMHLMLTPEEEMATVRALLDACPNIDQTDVGGRTALHYAANKVNLSVFDLLLAAGADITLRTRMGESVVILMTAVADDIDHEVARIVVKLDQARSANRPR